MSELFCQPCGDEGTQVDAAGFCLDCNEYLCQDCHKIHCKLRLTRHHRLLDGKQMLEHKPEMVTFESCTGICPDHPDKNIKYYCADHDVCGCSVCVNVDHRNCAGVDHIPQVVQELADKEDWTTIDDIEPIVKRLDNVITTSKTNIHLIEENDTKVANVINNFRAEIDAVLDKLENASKEKAEKHREEGVEKMKSYIDKASDYVKKLKDWKSKISLFKEQKQDCKLLITVKEMQKVEKEMHEALEEMEVVNCIKTVAFNSDKKFRACINALSDLGVLSETAICQVGNFENSSENADSQEDVTENSASLEVNGTYTEDVHVLSDTDKEVYCDVSTFTVLSDDRVVITDQGNYVLKMINVKKNKILSELYFDKKNNLENEGYRIKKYPYAAVKIKDNSLAVAVRNKGIVIVQAKSRLIIERVLTGTEPCSMSFCNISGYIYYCDNSNKISGINTLGRTTELLCMKGDELNRHSILSSAVNRTVSSGGYLYILLRQEIFVKKNLPQCEDIFEKVQVSRYVCLAMVSPDGSIKEKIDLPNEPEVIQSDEAGTLLFVLAKDVIYVMKVGSTHAQVLLTQDDGLFNAQGLAYDDKNRKLYVSMKNNNFIKVYKLSGV